MGAFVQDGLSKSSRFVQTQLCEEWIDVFGRKRYILVNTKE